MEKHDTESTRNTRGERLSQIKTHQGTWCPGERLRKIVRSERRTLRLDALNRLFPCQSKEAIDGCRNAEYQGRKPESIDSVCSSCANTLVRVL